MRGAQLGETELVDNWLRHARMRGASEELLSRFHLALIGTSLSEQKHEEVTPVPTEIGGNESEQESLEGYLEDLEQRDPQEMEAERILVRTL